jgi:hypothetical protein
MEYVIGWIMLSVLAGWLNSSRGNSFINGCLISLILSPLIGFIIVLATKPKIKKLKKRDIKISIRK